MLTADLVDARRAGANLGLRPWSAARLADAPAVATAMLEAARAMVGARREDVLLAWDAAAGEDGGPQKRKVVLGLRKLALDACVFENATGRSLAHSGNAPDPDALGATGSGLLASVTRAALRLQLGAEAPDAALTLDARHIVLRPVPRHPGLVLFALLDREHANLTLARLQIQRLDELFDEAGG